MLITSQSVRAASDFLNAVVVVPSVSRWPYKSAALSLWQWERGQRGYCNPAALVQTETHTSIWKTQHLQKANIFLSFVKASQCRKCRVWSRLIWFYIKTFFTAQQDIKFFFFWFWTISRALYKRGWLTMLSCFLFASLCIHLLSLSYIPLSGEL